MSSQPRRYYHRNLVSITAEGMYSNALVGEGPMGGIRMSTATGGSVTGRFTGRIAPQLASEWQRESRLIGGLSQVEGLVVIEDDQGSVVRMRYLGRRSNRYGKDRWRAFVEFEADQGGSLDWLNDVFCLAQIRIMGDDLHFEISELLLSAVDGANELPVAPLYTKRSPGHFALRRKRIVTSPLATHYVTIAEEGSHMEGRIEGTWPVGFSWGMHRSGRDLSGAPAMPMHFDLSVGLLSDDGKPLIQRYWGMTPRGDSEYGGDGAWPVAAVFEAPPSGELSFANEIVVVGTGWVEDNEINYDYSEWS